MNINIKKGMIDSHFHTLEMAAKGLDLEKILSELYKEGMEFLLDAGVHLNNFDQRLQYRDNHPGIYLAAGIHPNTPKDDWPNSLREELNMQGMHTEVKAIGETGLDFYREYSSPKDQYHLLETHYTISKQVKKPLIFHCRAAEKELTTWIEGKEFPYGSVLHCFTGDEALGKAAIRKGFMISFAGNVTFKNASSIRDSLKWIPIENLLIETDSPYLSPHPVRGKPNHPGHIGYTYDTISRELQIPLETLIEVINSNFKTFFQI